MTKLLTALTAVTILMAIAAAGTVKPKIFPTVGSVAAPTTVTISVEDLQRQVDMRTLPAMEAENLYRGHQPLPPIECYRPWRRNPPVCGSHRFRKPPCHHSGGGRCNRRSLLRCGDPRPVALDEMPASKVKARRCDLRPGSQA